MAEEPMMGQGPEGMAEAPSAAPPAPEKKEEAPALSVETMKSNYDGMDEDNKSAIGQLMQDPITGILDNLTSSTMFSEFSQTIGGAEEPSAPAPQEGIMGPGPATPPSPSAPAMSQGGGLAGMPYGETSSENKKIIASYKEGTLSLQGAQEFAKDIRKRRLSKDEEDTPSKEEMDVFYDMSYEYGEENLFPEKSTEKTAMAKGGLTAKVHDMMKKGMSRQEILNQIG